MSQVSFSQTRTQTYPQFRTQTQKNNNVFWGLLIFCGHSTQEPASTVCNDEQGELFYSVGPRPSQEPVLATDDRKNPDEVLGKQMQVNRPAG